MIEVYEIVEIKRKGGNNDKDAERIGKLVKIDQIGLHTVAILHYLDDPSKALITTTITHFSFKTTESLEKLLLINTVNTDYTLKRVGVGF